MGTYHMRELKQANNSYSRDELTEAFSQLNPQRDDVVFVDFAM